MLTTADGKGSFPVVMVGGVLGANKKWNIGNEVTNSILKTYPAACIIRPKVEPAVGAALLALNFLMKETVANDHS
uniref:Putative ovule protein n=1 Tax=Solanum chacoense TaxID=4108 RepID=A0A0V0GYK7_SOLCH